MHIQGGYVGPGIASKVLMVGSCAQIASVYAIRARTRKGRRRGQKPVLKRHVVVGDAWAHLIGHGRRALRARW